MANDTPLTDEYIAALLAKDAKAASSRAAAGLGLGVSKRPVNTAKPNTRFLRNILRDTDAHNSALLAKEEEESRARLRALEPKRRSREEQPLYSVRARRGGEGGPKRRRVDEEGCTSRDERGHKESPRHKQHGGRSRDDSKSRQVPRHARRSDDKMLQREDGHDHRHRRSRNRDDTRRRSRSPRPDRPGRERNKARSRSPARRSHSDIVLQSARPSKSRRRSRCSGSESPPGPRTASVSPPLRSRGRGVSTPTRTIDAHFEDGYDPAADVEGATNDWDESLACVRDRQKKRLDRLREAGFSDAQIQRSNVAESASAEGFGWAKKGESREWDKGKQLSSESDE